MGTCLQAVSFALPRRALGNEELAADLEKWTAADIARKTGIEQRYVAGPDECASDFAATAAEQLFAAGAARPEDIDFLLFVTETPDYYLPSSACLIQHRLGLRTDVIAYDINHGCAGYVQGLATAHAFLAGGLAGCGLLLTGDTYTRFIRPEDGATRTIFGDGGTATLLRRRDGPGGLGSFVCGTDGSGAERLIVREGGQRHPLDPGAEAPRLVMDGPAIFDFTLRVVPPTIEECLRRAGCTRDDLDLCLMHQANAFMLKHLITKTGLPADRTPVRMENYGNTVSSTIPILLTDLAAEGALQPQMRLLLVGFGVGLSWGACMLDLGESVPLGVRPQL